MKTNKKKGLGRGLSAILDAPDFSVDQPENITADTIARIPIDQIEANPFQPRDHFEETALNELSYSIKKQGIIQPITVRILEAGKYQLISGERRLKASKIAGLEQIPAYIRTADDQQMLEMALVENIQRENLNAMEIAISYQRLMDECKVNQEQLSERVGKSRTTVTNYLRLLKLPPAIQIAIRDIQISMGHARALINVDNVDMQLNLLHETIEQELSVREVEKRVRALNTPSTISEKTKNPPLPPQFVQAKERLCQHMDAKIKISRNNKGRGSLVIPFKSDSELERIITLMEQKQGL